MASVVAFVLGGKPKRMEADSVQEAKELLNLDGNYTASVDGEPANLGDQLDDDQCVTFSPAVKGGR